MAILVYGIHRTGKHAYHLNCASLDNITVFCHALQHRLTNAVIQILQPLSMNVLFTVGLLIISSIFPTRTQALGGAVFNTCSQLGASIGLTITSVIADSRTAASRDVDKTSPDALMFGYRAVFWTLFAWMVAVCFTGIIGLRRVGRIGVKRD